MSFLGSTFPNVKVRYDPAGSATAAATATATTTGNEKTSKLLQELLVLLNSRPGWQLPFQHITTAYHKNFGKQLKVKNYGVGKLAELLELPTIGAQIQVRTPHNRSILFSHCEPLRLTEVVLNELSSCDIENPCIISNFKSFTC